MCFIESTFLNTVLWISVTNFRLHQFTISTTAFIVICAIFISNLTSTFASTKLPTFLEPCVPVCPHDAVIKPCSVYVPHCVFPILPSVIFDEAETTWCFLDFVEPHHYPFDIPSTAEQLMNLFFSGEKRQISDVQRCWLQQSFLLFRSAALEMLVPVLTKRNGSFCTAFRHVYLQANQLTADECGQQWPQNPANVCDTRS